MSCTRTTLRLDQHHQQQNETQQQLYLMIMTAKLTNRIMYGNDTSRSTRKMESHTRRFLWRSMLCTLDVVSCSSMSITLWHDKNNNNKMQIISTHDDNTLIIIPFHLPFAWNFVIFFSLSLFSSNWVHPINHLLLILWRWWWWWWWCWHRLRNFMILFFMAFVFFLCFFLSSLFSRLSIIVVVVISPLIHLWFSLLLPWTQHYFNTNYGTKLHTLFQNSNSHLTASIWLTNKKNTLQTPLSTVKPFLQTSSWILYPLFLFLLSFLSCSFNWNYDTNS